jgi:pyridoxine 5-phosphate synthase
MLLGVNIDHIAVLREARKVNSPFLLQALQIVEFAGANQITIHLREDRRHIVDNDFIDILRFSNLPINLEMSINKEIIKIALQNPPHRITIVPENRDEVTTEGGLNVKNYVRQLNNIIIKMHKKGIEVSLFIDPEIETIELSKKLNVDMIELHTGKFANIFAMLNGNLQNSHHSIKELNLSKFELKKELKNSIQQLKNSAKFAKKLGLKVAGGHGLNYQNIEYIKNIKEIFEVNIGQSIIARSVFTGLEKAILDMKKLI